MEKLHKTKNGWETRVYLGRDANGKKITRRISGQDKSKVRLEAAKLEANRYNDLKDGGSFGTAAEEMLKERELVLSPSTIRGYEAYSKRLRENYSSFWGKKLKNLKKNDVQNVVNGLVKDGLAPKTVANIYQFINAVLKYKEINIVGVILPAKEKPDLHIPDEKTVYATLEAVKGNEIYVPVLLAAFGPMRRGEICALKTEDVSGNVIHVQRGIVQTDDGAWVMKPPKTYTSNRKLQMPDEVITELNKITPGKDGRYFQFNPNQLTDKFKRALIRAGIPHYRFHDLRHFCTSYLHAKGVPDIYIQQRTGHASPEVLRQVYTHTLTDQSEKMTTDILGWFDGIIDGTGIEE